MTISVSSLFKSLNKTNKQDQFVDATGTKDIDTRLKAELEQPQADVNAEPKKQSCCGGCGGGGHE